MAKKLIAVTEIRHNDEIIPAGDTLDASKFDKKQLEALYDAGAVRVDDGSSDTAPTNDETAISADQSAAASSPAKATPAPAKSAPAPAVRETANDKGSAK